MFKSTFNITCSLDENGAIISVYIIAIGLFCCCINLFLATRFVIVLYVRVIYPPPPLTLGYTKWSSKSGIPHTSLSTFFFIPELFLTSMCLGIDHLNPRDHYYYRIYYFVLRNLAVCSSFHFFNFSSSQLPISYY